MTQSSEDRLPISERKILRIFRPFYENNLACRLRHNEEVYELSDGPDIVKYIKRKKLQLASHVV